MPGTTGKSRRPRALRALALACLASLSCGRSVTAPSEETGPLEIQVTVARSSMLAGESLAVRVVLYNHQRDTIPIAQPPALCGMILNVLGGAPSSYYEQSLFCPGVPFSLTYQGYLVPPGDSVVVTGFWNGRTYPPQPQNLDDTRVAPAGRYSLRGSYALGIHQHPTDGVIAWISSGRLLGHTEADDGA